MWPLLDDEADRHEMRSESQWQEDSQAIVYTKAKNAATLSMMGSHPRVHNKWVI